MKRSKKEVISISDGKSVYEKLLEEIKKINPEILKKHNIFILGFYERGLKNFDGYTPREVLEMLKNAIEKRFRDAHPFLMDEMTDEYNILRKLKKELELVKGFYALMYFADTAILIFDVVLKNGRIWIPSPTGPLTEAFIIRRESKFLEKTFIFARKLDRKIFEKLPPYIFDVIYRKDVVLFSSTKELIEKVLKVIEKRLKEWKKKKEEQLEVKKTSRTRKKRKTIGFYRDEFKRLRKIEK